MKTILSILSILACLALPLWAEEAPPASVETEVDRTEITIGDQVRYKVKLDYANGVQVEKPNWGQGLEGFQILDFERGDPKKSGERWETVDEYTLSTFTPEDYVIPPLRIPVTLPSGATEVLETQPISIKVKSILPEDDKALELRAIKDPVAVFSGILTGRIITATLAALGILALLWGVWRWRKQGALVEPAAPPRPEHEVAFDRLSALRIQMGTWGEQPSQENCKLFGLEISETLREYLERRFGFLALELTTEEIREQVPMLALAGCEAKVLQVLDETDLLKFAKAIATRTRLSELIDSCEECVTETRRSSLEAGTEDILPADAERKRAAA
jgi:hypothetical protein